MSRLHLGPNGMVRYPGPTAMLRGDVAANPLPGRAPALNQTGRLVYRFECSMGCLPLPPFRCDAILRAAVLDACRMALSAARMLEPKPPAPATVDLFRSVFGHNPQDPFPGTWNIASGDLATCQFRMVEDALRRGNVLYRCDPCVGVREDPPAGSILDVHAIAIPAKNLVLLCPSFWQLSPRLKAGVLLHEMFHLRFQPFFKHDRKERRQNSAYCYEVFALRVTAQPRVPGQMPEQIAINKCGAAPIM